MSYKYGRVDLNVLCLRTLMVGPELAKEQMMALQDTRFTGDKRDPRPLGKVLGIERPILGGGEVETKEGEA